MEDVVFWSRMQFALTAMYHWLFVPLTLGLGLIISIMETIYYRTGKEEWKTITKFWMKLFGINFAIGVATGIILEFQFGTNWSNYSWFVGDIFGAPLAIEGMFAFFMESTFIAVMFFGWNKVSKGFHLASTWLTFIGASLSAVWILVANAWMQYPIGMKFNPDTVRNEMASFSEVLFSPMAINKFFHTMLSGWVVGAAVVVGISALYIYKKRHIDFSRKSISIAAPFGVLAMVLSIWTGDGSASLVAKHQPMKLAAMEGLYEGKTEAGLVAMAILNPDKKGANDGKEAFLMRIEIPKMLSLLAFRDASAFVPGIEDLINGYTLADGTRFLSATEKMERGTLAVSALKSYKEAKAAGNELEAQLHREQLEENYAYFGYGFVQDTAQLVPNVPIVFYAFRFMVIIGTGLLFLFLYFCYAEWRNLYNGWLPRLILVAAFIAIPFAYLVSQAGWVVAEVGRQPWVVQDIMPTFAAISKIEASSVITTFTLFCILFAVLLVAELGIIYKHLKKGF